MAIFRVYVLNQGRDLSSLCVIYFRGIWCGLRFAYSENPSSACVRLCSEAQQKKKKSIAGNPLAVRLRRCQWSAGTLRRNSYGNSLLSPAVAGGSNYVSALIEYWCSINDTRTHACTHALESARTPLHVHYNDRRKNLSKEAFILI